MRDFLLAIPAPFGLVILCCLAWCGLSMLHDVNNQNKATRFVVTLAMVILTLVGVVAMWAVFITEGAKK